MVKAIKLTGIYKIINLVNGKSYIGSSSCSFKKRREGHWSHLHRQSHPNKKLQAAWNKYGADAFKFEILLICDPEDCLFYEQIYLDYYKPEYNICPLAGSTRGFHPSQETRRKQSIARLGRVVSAETRQRMSAAQAGRKLSEEHKKKIGISSKKRNAGSGNPMFGKFEALHPTTKIFESDRLRIKGLFEQGFSGREIAKIMNLSYSGVYKYKNYTPIKGTGE